LCSQSVVRSCSRFQFFADSAVGRARDPNPEPIRRLLNEFATIAFHSNHSIFNAQKYSQNDFESLFAGFGFCLIVRLGCLKIHQNRVTRLHFSRARGSWFAMQRSGDEAMKLTGLLGEA
jgi:glucan biosynthesis protein